MYFSSCNRETTVINVKELPVLRIYDAILSLWVLHCMLTLRVTFEVQCTLFFDGQLNQAMWCTELAVKRSSSLWSDHRAVYIDLKIKCQEDGGGSKKIRFSYDVWNNKLELFRRTSAATFNSAVEMCSLFCGDCRGWPRPCFVWTSILFLFHETVNNEILICKIVGLRSRYVQLICSTCWTGEVYIDYSGDDMNCGRVSWYEKMGAQNLG